MTKIAFMFPGQGSQSVEMGKDFIESNPTYGSYYERANSSLNYDLTHIMLEGPQDELTLTYNAQPALLTTSSMFAAALKDRGVVPDYTIGHSLGEYSALVASEAMTFDDAVLAVHKRGVYMNEAVPAGQGSMAAILGMDEKALQDVCEKIQQNGQAVQIANYNCPGQIVISGSKAGVSQACLMAKENGAKRAIELDVSGPFHSSLMEPASENLKNTLDELSIEDASIPVISNVTATETTKASQLKDLLIEQLYSPVKFEQSIRYLLNQGVTTFVECGPGKVLSGLVKKIDRSATIIPVYNHETLEAAVAQLKG